MVVEFKIICFMRCSDAGGVSVSVQRIRCEPVCLRACVYGTVCQCVYVYACVCEWYGVPVVYVYACVYSIVCVCVCMCVCVSVCVCVAGRGVH